MTASESGSVCQHSATTRTSDMGTADCAIGPEFSPRALLVPAFRSSSTIAATTFHEFRKVMGTSKSMALVPLLDFEVPGSSLPLALQELQIGGPSVAFRSPHHYCRKFGHADF